MLYYFELARKKFRLSWPDKKVEKTEKFARIWSSVSWSKVMQFETLLQMYKIGRGRPKWSRIDYYMPTTYNQSPLVKFC